MITIAIQGERGAFHELAAQKFFKHKTIKIVPCESFNDLFKNVEQNNENYGIVAIENSLAGGIVPNYKLLDKYNVKIVGEVYLRVKQNLLVKEGQSIKDLKEVYSHPMAIRQCYDFFEQFPHIKLIESLDTAISAKWIAGQKNKNYGAIASKLAAEIYGLEIMHESIETNKKNYTRFLIINHFSAAKKVKNINKASIYFALKHETGSLSKVLSLFSFYNINLSKIQSMPIIGKEWEYLFYVDLLFDDIDIYLQSLKAIKPMISNLKILGEYEGKVNE